MCTISNICHAQLNTMKANKVKNNNNINSNNSNNNQLTFPFISNSCKIQQKYSRTPQTTAKGMQRILLCCALAVVCAFTLCVAPANCDHVSQTIIPFHTASIVAPQHREARQSRHSYSAIYDHHDADATGSDYGDSDDNDDDDDDFTAYSSAAMALSENNKVDALAARFNSYVLPARYESHVFYVANQLGLDTLPDLGHQTLDSMSLVTETRENICQSCMCARTKNAFLSISCDFQKKQKVNLPSIFGSNLKVPSDATSITIKLGPTTNFRLERGFFNNNTVNSLTIEGTYSDEEQVEINTEAFMGNNGPYPEIHLHNVFSVIVRTRAISDNAKFTVRNSNDLILFPDAFENAKINGLFIGINDLRIHEKAFNSAQAKLRIESSFIDNIYRFEASLREIRFINCTIGTINGGTFDVITINSIVFESCRIDHIKARAITEKLYSNHVSITGAIIGSIESEAIYGSGIAELVLTKNKIDTIQDNAIHVTALNATISHNNIKHLGNNWLHIQEWSNIVIERNQFGVFGSMQLENTKQPESCRFASNSITKPLPNSLNVINPYCMLREISVNLPCRCNLDWLQELSARDLRSETYCTIDVKLGRCFNATTFNVLKYLNEVCDETKTTLDCVANQNLKKIKGNFFTSEELERQDQSIPQLYIYIAICSLLLLALVCIVIVLACRFCRRRQKQLDNSCNFGSSPHLHEFSPDELQIIEQTMRLMQKKYPKIYRQVKDHSQTLLQLDLPERRCIKTISKIVNVLEKTQNSGEDFGAFNRLLTQHMQPRQPTAPIHSNFTDSIYSEPGLTGTDGGFYRSGTIIAIPSQDYETGNYAINNSLAIDDNNLTANAHGQTNLQEHIYAEPNCQQEPLLRNEYASPADRNLDTADLYSEPFSSDRELASTVFGPAQARVAQYALPMRNQKLPVPPTSKRPNNLPGAFTESPAQAIEHNDASLSVKQRAQNLQSRPEFHPNKLVPPPGSQWHYNRQLVSPPVYALPNHRQDDAQARLASPESIDEECDMDMRGAAALTPDNSSNHSGGSKETVKIDDVIEYVDA